MSTIQTIIPIFMIIALGAFAQRQGFFPQAFLGPANRLVFYLAIPAMIFRAISRSSLGDEMSVAVLSVTLASVALAFLLAMILCLDATAAFCRFSLQRRQASRVACNWSFRLSLFWRVCGYVSAGIHSFGGASRNLDLYIRQRDAWG
jgi:predicted permease